MKTLTNSSILILILLSLVFSNVFAQKKSTGINNTNPSSKAALDIRTTPTYHQGFFMPRLASADTSLIGVTIGKDRGLMFYDSSSTGGFVRWWDGAKWQGGNDNSGNSGNYWQTNGNALTIADTIGTGLKYLGTSTNTPLMFYTNGTERMRLSKTGNLAIGKQPSGGIPLQVKSNGVGAVLQIEQATATFSLFEFRQNPNKNAKLQMYDNGNNVAVQLSADPLDDSYLRVGNLGIGTTSPSVSLDLSSRTDAIALPVGNTSEQPISAFKGMIRYNSEKGWFEGYDGTTWNAFATGSLASPWTKSGSIVYNTLLTDNVGIGTTTPNTNLTLAPTYQLGWQYSAGNTSVAHTIGRSLSAASPLEFGTTFNPGPTGPIFQFLQKNGGTNYVMSMLYNGNVGIGISTPSEKLTIMNDLYGLSHINNANTVKMSSYIGNSYTTTSIPGASVGTQTDHPFFIYVNNNGEKFYIGNSTQNYNVGIGTANPLTKVQITTTEIEPANSGISATGHLRLEGTGTPIVTDIGVVDDTYNGGWIQVHNKTNQALNYPLLLNPNGGNVGIGTTKPNAPLQFSNEIANRKIVLYDGFNNDHQYYGFGINGSTLRYQTDATSSDHVFYSANSATSSTELMRIMGTGNIGIGTSTPAYRLTLTGGLVNAIYVGSSNILTSSQTSSQLILQSGTGLFVYPGMNPEWTISVSDNDPAAGQPTDGFLVFSRRTSSIATPTKLMVLDNNSLNPFADGGMALGATTYRWSTVFATNGTINTSDRRSKKDIQPIKYGLNEVLKLQPISYKWKNDSLNTNKLGLIAQDLEKILPEVVVTPKMPNEQYGVYYSDMIPVLIKAIQEQQKMIESLQSELNSLKK